MNLSILNKFWISERNNQSGFLFAEVLVVVVIIGTVFTSILFLEDSILKGVRYAFNRQNTSTLVNNAKGVVLPLFECEILERDKKIQQAFEKFYKSEKAIEYKIENCKSAQLNEMTDLKLANLKIKKDGGSVGNSINFLVVDFDPRLKASQMAAQKVVK